MINNLLKIHLEAVAARQRRWRFWSKVAACWTGAALLGFLLILLQREGGWSSSLSAPLIAGLGIFAVIIVTSRHRRNEPDWRSIAKEIEARHPELDGRLLTAVQQVPEGEGGLNYLQEQLVREAALHRLRNDWEAIVPASRVALSRIASLAALAVFLLALSGLHRTGGHFLFTRNPDSGVTVTPGDVTLERGSSLVVLARFGGALPPKVDLVIGPAPETTRHIALAKSLADPVFGGSVPEVASNLIYHIEYAGQRTPDFKVTVFEYPRLERADADLTYPEYTGLEPKRIENTRRVSAVEGSRLGLKLQFNKPVTSARLVGKDEAHSVVTLQVESNRPVATITSFPLEASLSYDLQLVDAEGRTNKVPSQFVFAALSNRAPEIKLASPRGDTRPSALEEIAFEGTVWDDFGVRTYGLAYAMVGQETKFIELGQIVPAREKRTFHYVLRLEDLCVKPDELVSWFTWADDVGPDGQVRRTPGDMYFAEVRPFDEVFREGQGGENQEQAGQQPGEAGGQGRQTGRLADLQKQIINATWNLQRQAGGAKKPAAPPAAKPAADPKPAPNRSSLRSVPMVVQPQFAGQRAPGSGGVRPLPRGDRSQSNSNSLRSATGRYSDDAGVVRDAQADAIEQARATMERQSDPGSAALWQAAIERMEKALDNLKTATASPATLPQALLEEQAAYQALLKLEQHEFQVTRGQRGQRGNASSRDQQMQRQLDQMDLTQSENRYETQSQAQSPQSPERREQLQVMNRLQELARRQQDLNDRLRELQSALQEARTEAERDEIRRQLKRLQEEEQQMLADVDELRQRMDRPENQSRMTEERRQLDQTREDVQRAAQSAEQGTPSQALASGTRAQRQLQDIRDQMRRENSSQFGEDMRQMRAEARELARQQEDLVNQIEQQANPQQRSLSGPRPDSLRDQVARQRERMTNLVDRASQVSQDAESSEPLLARQLYDTLRQFGQGTGRDLKEIQEKLLDSGLLTRDLYDQLQKPTESDGAKLLDVASEMLRLDFLPPAQDSSQRLRTSVNDLARGVERAAESVIGDDTESLRLAQQQIDQLTEQIRREMAEAQGGGTNQQANAGSRGEPQGSGRERGNQAEPGSQPGSQPGSENSQQARAAGQRGQQSGSQSDSQPNESGQNGEQPGNQGVAQNGNQPNGNPGEATGQPPGQRGQQGQRGQGGERGGNQDLAQNGEPQPGQNGNQPGNRGAQRGGNRGGNRANNAQNNGGPGGDASSLLDQVLNAGGGGGWAGGPITGEDYLRWSDGLRNVEEMIEIPDLRLDVSRIRDRARILRQEYKRDGKVPDWAVVKLQVEKPLVEVRDRIADELARRGSQQALVPIDRDPVPNRYSELVKRYYEELGKDK